MSIWNSGKLFCGIVSDAQLPAQTSSCLDHDAAYLRVTLPSGSVALVGQLHELLWTGVWHSAQSGLPAVSALASKRQETEVDNVCHSSRCIYLHQRRSLYPASP